MPNAPCKEAVDEHAGCRRPAEHSAGGGFPTAPGASIILHTERGQRPSARIAPLQPALVLGKLLEEDASPVLLVARLVVLERRAPVVGEPEHRDLAGRMAHDVAEALRHAAHLRLRVVDHADALRQRHLEPVGHDRRGAALVQVVRLHPNRHQAVHEVEERVRVIVHAGEQDRLVADGAPRLAQHAHRGGRLVGQLARMVELGHHHDRLRLGVAREHGEQLIVLGDALRERGRDARGEADIPDGGEERERLEVLGEQVVGVQERVPAADRDVVDLRMVADVLGELRDAHRRLVGLQPGEVAPVAVAAVGERAVVGDDQHRLQVLVLPALDRGVIGCRLAALGRGHIGQAHPADGVGRVEPVHEAEVIRGDQDGIALLERLELGYALVAQPERLLKVLE